MHFPVSLSIPTPDILVYIYIERAQHRMLDSEATGS